ncbi:MAG TPA: hypothetical protein VGA54_03975, partial [Candidatus Deferrimicrobium sp.]
MGSGLTVVDGRGSTSVRTRPLGPRGPTGSPLSATETPPALPTVSRNSRSAAHVMRSPGWRMASFGWPPSIVTCSQLGSLAAIDSSWTAPEAAGRAGGETRGCGGGGIAGTEAMVCMGSGMRAGAGGSGRTGGVMRPGAEIAFGSSGGADG